MMLGARPVVFGVVALAGLSACDSDGEAAEDKSGLAGMYLTTAYTVSQPCDLAVVLEPYPPYFRVVDDEFSPSTVIDVYACEAPDPSRCSDYPFVQFAERTGSGIFHTEETTQDGTEESCSVTWTGWDVRKTESGVDIMKERRSGNWMGPDCAGNLTNADIERARMLPCDISETWTGEKL